MAEWKKIIVSGSDISQLNNDSGYLVQTGTIDSASVAARATTLSADATASIADRATSASIADALSQLATASHALTAVTASHALNVPDTASFALNAQSASVAVRATTLSGDATASYADTASISRTSDTASVAISANELRSGATASFALRATSASIADELSQLATASIADTATSASIADEISQLATASFADTAGTARSADSASVAARATTLSADATASQADSATTASHAVTAATASHALDIKDGIVTTDKIVDGNVTNVKLANDSVTIGTTEIDLGATATSLTGLTSISATTGSFVLQVFESSSTIVTSGSNIFGDDQSDIQQFTGSILQTGSMTTTGTITAEEVSSDKFSGSFSGSFQGDGSNLTGLATVLTVDGDTGTEDVDLLADDLQILGTSNEIESVVSKVGNDVKVTLGLPDTVDVTASVATRANGLAPTVTASQADSATTASIADLASTLSPTATASIADTATTASHAVTAVSASAIIAGAAFPTTAGLEGQGIALDSNGDFIYGDFFGTGSTAKLNQSVAAATWSFTHSLDEPYPIVQVYNSDGDQVLPARIIVDGVNNVEIRFPVAVAGVAAAMVGGMGISASFAVQAGSATTASQAGNADTASVAVRATTLSADATASFADLASDARTADSASVAARATLLSSDATASFADLASDARTATTASHALGGAGDFSGSFIGDGSGLTGLATNLNFDGDSGATTVDLLTTTMSINGTAQEITTTVTADTVTISLPDDVTIGDALTVTGDATVGGNLVVNGSIVSASSLAVADQFIILASGSNGAIDGGIIINQIDDDPDGKGKAFAYDSSANRWALESNLNDTASVITPDAFMGVIQEGTSTPVGGSDPVYGGTNGNGTIFVDTNNNEAYIYI